MGEGKLKLASAIHFSVELADNILDLVFGYLKNVCFVPLTPTVPRTVWVVICIY